jgi:hypothetical protein
MAPPAPPVPKPIAELCKGLKRDIIDLLTLLLHEGPSVQEIIRENGGIQLILSMSNIDDDNPCIILEYCPNSRYQRESYVVHPSINGR